MCVVDGWLVVALALIYAGWELGRVVTALKDIRAELSEARWERGQRERLRLQEGRDRLALGRGEPPDFI